MTDQLERVRNCWANQIEHMLSRPAMYCKSTEAFEDAVRTALTAWEVITDTGESKRLPQVRQSGRQSALTFAWNNVMKAAYEENDDAYLPQVARFSTIMKATSSPGISPGMKRDRHLHLDEMAAYLRLVWERIRDPIERLAALGEED